MTSLVNIDISKTRRRIEDFLRKDATLRQTLETAELLGVEIAYNDVNERPYFGPEQVRCVHQLEVGAMYEQVHNRVGGRTLFVVTGRPHRRDNGGWGVSIRILRSGTQTNISLQDFNLFPYIGDNGERWNNDNWIAFTDDSWHLSAHTCPATA